MFCLFNIDCQPMVKRYYLQYQWMPFYIATLSLLFYMPYVLFRIVNTDMISLKASLGKDKVSVHLYVYSLCSVITSYCFILLMMY